MVNRWVEHATGVVPNCYFPSEQKVEKGGVAGIWLTLV